MSFPDETFKRRAIVVLTQHEREKCEYEPNSAHILLNDEMYVLQYPLQNITSRVLRDIVDMDLVRPGVVLIQNPYDLDDYVAIDEAIQRFSLTKLLCFSNLCRLLGAKRFDCKQLEVTTKSGSKTISLNGSRMGVGGGVQIQSGNLSEFLKEINIHDVFVGGSAQITQAESFLKGKKLWQDPMMRNLVESRSGTLNSMTKRVFTLNLSNEVQKNVDVVAKIKIPTFLDFKARYQEVLETRDAYSLTIEIDF
jgi:hypothetical protein